MASKPAFADASFFFALAAKRDFAHEAAAHAFESLLKKNRSLVTSDYVVDEALTLTKVRTNAVIATALLDRIERSGAISIEFVGPDRFARAKTSFRTHADHGYSFTDCTSFIIMRELGISDALTTDRHFEAAGFHALLAPKK